MTSLQPTLSGPHPGQLLPPIRATEAGLDLRLDAGHNVDALLVVLQLLGQLGVDRGRRREGCIDQCSQGLGLHGALAGMHEHTKRAIVTP